MANRPDAVASTRETERGFGVVWSKYRGPDTVTFSETDPVDEMGEAVTTAAFSELSEYVLPILAWDDSGGQGAIMAGRFFCCWTNDYVTVHVR